MSLSISFSFIFRLLTINRNYDLNYRNCEQEKAIIIALSDLLLLGKQTKQLVFSNLQQVFPISLCFPSNQLFLISSFVNCHLLSITIDSFFCYIPFVEKKKRKNSFNAVFSILFILKQPQIICKFFDIVLYCIVLYCILFYHY